MDRPKMPRRERAKQFAPFDALKGLSEALRLKEYEHECVAIGELGDEQIKKISDTLSSLKKNDMVSIEYYDGGHKKIFVGKVKLEIENQIINLNTKKVELRNLLDIQIVN